MMMRVMMMGGKEGRSREEANEKRERKVGEKKSTEYSEDYSKNN